jgi:hypothetical protein
MHGNYLGNISNSSSGTRPRRGTYSRRSSADSSRRSSASKKGDANTTMFDNALDAYGFQLLYICDFDRLRA